MSGLALALISCNMALALMAVLGFGLNTKIMTLKLREFISRMTCFQIFSIVVVNNNFRLAVISHVIPIVIQTYKLVPVSPASIILSWSQLLTYPRLYVVNFSSQKSRARDLVCNQDL